MAEEVYFVTRCLECETISNADRDLCSECGIFLYNDERLCSECLKLVKSDDEKCYSCGKKIEKKEAEEKQEEGYQFDQEEKEKFLDEFQKKTYGIEIGYFLEDLKARLKFYPTVKLLFSDKCPKKLAEHFGMEHKVEIPKKLEQFVKSFAKTLELVIFGMRYEPLAMSIVAFFWLRQHYNDLHENKGILVLLKAENKYYEKVLSMSSGQETDEYIFRRMTINLTLQDMLFAEQIDRGDIRTYRAGTMFQIAEVINGNRGKSKDKIRIKEETEQLYINCINDIIYVLGYYMSKEEWKRAATLSGEINEKIIYYGKKLRNYSVFKFTKRIFQLIDDYLRIVRKETLNENERRVITQSYKLLEGVIQEEDKEEGKATSKNYTMAAARSIVKELQDESMKKLLKGKHGELLGEIEEKVQDKVKDTSTCPECKEELELDSNFCGHCGTKM